MSRCPLAPSSGTWRAAWAALASILVVGLMVAGPGMGARAAEEEPDAAAEAADPADAGVGTVIGQVFDRETGEPLAGATVTLVGRAPPDGGEPRQEVQTTNAQGAFRFSRVPAGTYQVRFTRAGYRDSTMTDFEVRARQVNRADFPLPVLPAATAGEVLQLEEFVVEASTVEEEVVALELRMESDQLLNILSEEEFSKFAASDVAEALQRVAGVNIVEGQFAIIRGLEDRYSSTLYNGAFVPSPDPDRQSVQLDLFPSDVVQNLVVAKSFSPEQPGNSAGGSIDILTYSYPDDTFEIKLKAGTGWNDNAVDRFIEVVDSTDIDVLLDRLAIDPGSAELEGLAELREEGFRFIEGNPVGRDQERTGDFFDDVDDVLESDFNVTIGGRREFEDREFRLRAVWAREIDFTTAEGFQQAREPAEPLQGEPMRMRDPETGMIITIPGPLEETGDLSLGELSLTAGRYDLTTSVYEKRTTAYGAFGFDLDDEGDHRIDASVFYTEKEEDTAQLRESGFLPGIDYPEVFRRQVEGLSFAPLFEGIRAPGSFAGTSFRDEAGESLIQGALALSNFRRSQTFERDRDLIIYQINGDHTFDRLPGLHVSWATNWAKTNQDEVSLGMDYFFEPCGYTNLIPCPAGESPIGFPDEFPATVEALGPGAFAVNNRLTLSATAIEENSHFTRVDGDWEIPFSEASTFTVAGGYWRERAERTVESAFLDVPSLGGAGGGESCRGTGQMFACFGETAVDLGATAFDEITLDNVPLTENESSREIDAWHIRGKLTFWEKLDLMGGVRHEEIFIESLNDPFLIGPDGELQLQFGGPRTFPSRFLFFDRRDNPFLRTAPNGTSFREIADPPPEGTVFNDQLLNTSLEPGPCDGDDGSEGEIQCVDIVEEAELRDLFNGEIDEMRWLPSGGFALRPIEGLSVRGFYSKTVARPSFRELGYYVTVEPGSDDYIVGNPNLQLSDVRSWDLRVEYTWGAFGDLLAVSGFIKDIEQPIESIVVRDPTNLELDSAALFRTFFNNPDTADLMGAEAEFRKSIDFFGSYAPDWLKYLSVGGNFTYIDAEVDRTEAELARGNAFFGVAEGDQALFEELAPSRRLFNQPEWIANADITFDHPGWGTRITVAYFAISDVLDAVGTATVAPDGEVLAFTLDRYVDTFQELRVTFRQTFQLPGDFGELSFSASGKNLTDSKRSIIYDPEQTAEEIAEREFRVGRDYSFSITYTRRF